MANSIHEALKKAEEEYLNKTPQATFFTMGDKAYDGKVITYEEPIRNQLNVCSAQVRFQRERYAVAGVSSKKTALLIHSTSGVMKYVKIEKLVINKKKEGEPYGLDLITTVCGEVIEEAGRFYDQQKAIRERFWKESK